MKIRMCAFIPKSLGSSISMYDLPKGLVNQSSFDHEVKRIAGSWLKEPYPSIVFCGSDNREFGNMNGTSRLYAFNEKPINLAFIGRFRSIYGQKHQLFNKKCDASARVFVQLAYSKLSITEMDKFPKIPYQGGRFPVIEKQKQYGYVHTQSPMTGIADQDLDTITDLNSNFSKIKVKTSAGYPYLEPFSPNIDFEFTIIMRRLSDKYEVEIIGCHNEFPCYELYINDSVVYKYMTAGHGPNPVNLNRSFSFTIKKKFLINRL